MFFDCIGLKMNTVWAEFIIACSVLLGSVFLLILKEMKTL